MSVDARNGEKVETSRPQVHPDQDGANGAMAVEVMDEPERIESARASPRLPSLPPPVPEAEKVEADQAVRALRRVHVAGSDEEQVGELDFLPALMFPFRDEGRVRAAYPLFLFPPEDASLDRLFLHLGDLLGETMSTMEQEGEDRELADNLQRLERIIRFSLRGQVRPREALEVVKESGVVLLGELELGEQALERMKGSLERFVAAMPDGLLLPFGEHSPMFLLMWAYRNRIPPRHEAFQERIRQLLGRLQALVEVEYQKTEAARSPAALRGALGGAAARFLDPGSLAAVMGSGGTEPMRLRRQERIQEVIQVLQAALRRGTMPRVTVVSSATIDTSYLDDMEDVLVLEDADPLARAGEVFDGYAEEMVKLFWAVRVASLEVEDAYEPICHSPILANLTWHDLDATELGLLPPVVAIETPSTLLSRGMASLSQILLSTRPVQVLVQVRSVGTPGVEPGQNPAVARLELGYFGISHREAMVEQSTAARPEHLMESLVRGIRSTRTSLHVVASALTMEGRLPRLGAWLHAGAAVESRAHPFFRYDPAAGRSWAQRLSFDGNPRPEADWPYYELPCLTHDGEETSVTLAFTFADFALMEPSYAREFHVVASESLGEHLVTVDRWVNLSQDELFSKVPYIWAVDTEYRLVRLAVSRRLAMACRDRLGFWRTLQEMAGINNEYARQAAEEARREAMEEARRERAELAARQRAELARVKEDEARVAMAQLADAILGVPGRYVAQAVSVAPPLEDVELEVASPEVEEEVPDDPEEDTDQDFGDVPYIDTPLCTTCNECTAINSRMFAYNANKQAYIADPAAGTFAQLVLAAEKCPARIIHPGKPLNPDEPDLEALMERGARFR